MSEREAGRELDALIAERVMGEPRPSETPEFALEQQLAGCSVTSPLGFWINLSRYEDGDVPTWWPLPFSTQISAAWRVVDAMMACEDIPGFDLNVWQVPGREIRYAADFGAHWPGSRWGEAEADTAPLAICLAALATTPEKHPPTVDAE